MRRVLALLIVTAALAAWWIPSTVSAAEKDPQPQLLLGFQTSTAAGQPIALSAYLVDPAGNPIRGEAVHFSMRTTFLNTGGELDLGDPVTGSAGLALLEFTPRIEGRDTITASFAGDSVFAPANASRKLQVEAGPQLYEVDSPFRIPGADIWMVTGILGVVWGLYLIALIMGVRVARGRGAS